MEHDVFICHSTADARTAAEICDLLEANEVRCWIAPRDPVAGIPYSQQIVAAIEAAPVLLLVFSGNANNTRAVLSELELAANRGKVILPVRIDDVPPASALEFYVRAIHWFDAATQPLHEVGRELVRQVKTLAARPPVVTDRTQTVEAPHHNLPFSLTSFVGREREIGELEDLLQTARLVTLCGAGGIGKTSLAVHVSTRKLDAYPDGVWFVDLAQAEDESLLVATFAAVFGLEESPSRPIAETLLAYLRKKHLLLIADNCEHVVAEAAEGQGIWPQTSLTAGSDGYLYGTALYGGDFKCGAPSSFVSGCGTVYRLAPGHSPLQGIYQFPGGKDGSQPSAPLLYFDGVLYGETLAGGTKGHGTVFKLPL